MNEHLLQGLMQLFAIIAKLDGDYEEEREVVRGFLSNQFNFEDTERYLAMFDVHLADHSLVRNKKMQDSEHKLTVRDSSKMLIICNQINEELTQRQKVVVIFVLFSLINADHVISAAEYDFLTTVADIFNISIREFRLIENFALDSGLLTVDSEDLLILSHERPQSYTLTRYIHAHNLEGYLAIMRLPSIGTYMVKYSGGGLYYLNGLPMRENEIYTLTTGSTIRGGKLAPIYYSDVISRFMDDNAGDKISFKAVNVGFTFSNGNTALHDVNIAEESGKMIGLMGPSGAGKSTLLEVLNGNLKPTTGQILINSADLHSNKKEMEGVIGYVPQDDLLIEDLTVFQNLYYAAKLSFGNYNETQLNDLVTNTLLSLGLQDTSNLRVGSVLDKMISGGERKRVNIGLELLRAPSVLFLDEPTSGLSSRDSLSIMDLLKELALTGKLIFVVIHQPSSDIFKMFDKLFILDKGGYPIYYGNPIEAIIYFKSRINQVKREQAVCPECGNVNPEQIFDIIETRTVNQYGQFTNERKVSPQAWNSFYKAFIKTPVLPPRQDKLKILFSKASPIKQLIAFTARDFRSKINNLQYLIINGMQAPLLACLLAFINRAYNIHEITGEGTYSFKENDNVPVYFFISVIIALFMGLTVSAEEIFHDRKILKREAFLNLSRTSYLLSKVAILFAISALQMLIFVVIGNFILDIRGMTWEYWLVMFSAACGANMIGLNISSAFNSAVTIYILIPILLIPQLVLGGIVIPYERINPFLRAGTTVPFIGEIMTSRWAFEALMVQQYTRNPYENRYYYYDKVTANSEYYRFHLLPALQTKVESINFRLRDKGKGGLDSSRHDLNILQRHIRDEMREVPAIKFAKSDQLTPEKYTEGVGQEVMNYFNSLSEFYGRVTKDANNAKNKLVLTSIATPALAEANHEFEQAYVNDAVSRMVRNTDDANRFVETEAELVRKMYPVYDDPTKYNGFFNFRTHFYAPRKFFAGKFFDTLYFNVCVIWTLTLLLYISLYLDLPKRAINLLSFKKRR
ncbi:MAG: ATP-binding cassette domain-containing protein [Bacteroidota bacterium]